MATLLASAEASSIESSINNEAVIHTQSVRRGLTSGNDNGLPHCYLPQCLPHVPLHLRIDTSRKLIDQ